MSAYLGLRFLHLVAAAVWLGGGLLAPLDVRASIGDAALHAGLMRRLRATATLMNWAALLTVLTGVALMWASGGFFAAPLRIHVGLALTLLTYAISRFLIRPVIMDLQRAVGRELPAAEAAALTRRFTVAVRVEDLTRVVVLVLMVFPISS